MSLEEATVENTKAINALTAALGARAGAPVTPTAEAGKKPPGRPRKPTLADVKAMAEKVVDQKDKPAAVAIIAAHGATRLADLDESKYAAFIAACEVALAADDGGEGEGDAEL